MTWSEQRSRSSILQNVGRHHHLSIITDQPGCAAATSEQPCRTEFNAKRALPK
jgi:hypothetical protein